MYRQLKEDMLIQQATATHLTNSPLVVQRTELATAPAYGDSTGFRLQLNQQDESPLVSYQLLAAAFKAT